MSASQMELVEKYRFHSKTTEPNLVEGAYFVFFFLFLFEDATHPQSVSNLMRCIDIIAGLKQSTVQHNYWVSSPHKSQYLVRF